jgi:PAS domain S-box-containing protein
LFLPSLHSQKNPNSVPQKLKKTTLQLSWEDGFQFAGYYAAKEKGFYREAGLDVELLRGSPSINPINIVLSGKAEFGVAASDIMLSRLKGKPIIALAAIFQHSPSIFISLKKSKIKTPKDLPGKKVMLAEKTQNAEFYAILNKEGIPNDSIMPVPYVSGLENLINGKIDVLDAYLTDQPFMLNKKDIPYNAIKPATYGIDFYGDCLFTKASILKTDPEKVKAFVNASIKGWEYAMKHQTEIIQLIKCKYKVKDSAKQLEFEATKMKELMLPDIVKIGHMNPDRWRHIARIFIKNENIPMKNGEVDSIIKDFTYLPYEKMDYSKVYFGILIASLIVIIALAYSYSLKKLISLKTKQLENEIANHKKTVKEKAALNEELKSLINRQEQIIDERASALKESESFYRTTINHLEDAILVVDSNLNITMFNNSLVELNKQYTKEIGNFTGMNIYEAFPFLPENVRKEYEDVFKAGKILRTKDEFPINSQKIVTETSKIPIIRDGKVQEIITVIRDITEEKENEDMIKASEANLSTIFESSESLIMSVDKNMKYIRFNKAYSETIFKIFNYEPQAGRYIFENTPPDRIKFWLPTFEKALKGEKLRYETPLKNGDEIRYYEFWLNPIIQEGDIKGFIAIINDVTARKKMEKEAEIRREQLIQADKMLSLGSLVAGVAHEINNPNNSIVMNVPMLQRAWASIKPIMDAYMEERGDFIVGGLPYSEMQTLIPSLLEGIKGGAERIKTIVSGLKDYARQDPGMPKEKVSLNEVIDKALIILSNKIKNSTRNLKVDLSDKNPLVLASSQKIEQVVINLLENACNALHDSNKKIEIKTDLNENNNTANIIIRDEGVGISASNLKYVQDPFFTTRRDSGGTGLGLSISSGIIKDYGGELHIESITGAGTNITVSMPAHIENGNSKENL